MTSHHTAIRAPIDPERSDPLQGGERPQDLAIVPIDDLRERRPALTLPPSEARELALELLVLAERAARQRREVGR